MTIRWRTNSWSEVYHDRFVLPTARPAACVALDSRGYGGMDELDCWAEKRILLTKVRWYGSSSKDCYKISQSTHSRFEFPVVEFMQISILQTPTFSLLVVALCSYLTSFVISCVSVFDDIFDWTDIIVPETLVFSFGSRAACLRG